MPAHSPIERLVIAEIERRRSYVRPPKDTTLGTALDRIQQDLRASVRRESALQAAWKRLSPASLGPRVRAVSLRGGTLTLAASDQSAKYLVDRWLTPSNRAALSAALGSVVTRVTVKIAQA